MPTYTPHENLLHDQRKLTAAVENAAALVAGLKKVAHYTLLEAAATVLEARSVGDSADNLLTGLREALTEVETALEVMEGEGNDRIEELEREDAAAAMARLVEFEGRMARMVRPRLVAVGE